MKSKPTAWIIIALLVVSNVFAPDLEESPYQKQLSNNEDFFVESSGYLLSSDLQGYSGTIYLNSGSSAEMPKNFQGMLVLTEAQVTMPDGRIVKGTGSCNKDGCTILKGETGEGDTKLSGGAFRVKNDGTIDVFAYATIGEGDSARKVFHVTNLRENKGWTVTFDVEEDSEVASIIIGTKGTIVFNPKRNSIKPYVGDPSQNAIFLIKSFDMTTESVILERDNVDIEVEKGMYLTQGTTKISFNENDCSGSCVFLSDKKIKMSGEGYKIKFDENNPVVNVYPQDKLKPEYERQKRAFFDKYKLSEDKYNTYSFNNVLEYPGQEAEKLGIPKEELEKDYESMKKLDQLFRLFGRPSIMEVSPKGGTIEIENRNVLDYNGILGISGEKAQAPKMTITGDKSDDIWAEIKNDGISLQTGKNGIINPRNPRRGETEGGIPIEINVLDEFGNSLIKDKEGKQIKAAITSGGGIFFSTTDANINLFGVPYCTLSYNSITGKVITGMGISRSFLSGCKDDYFQFNKAFTSKAAIESARDDYLSNLDKGHDFKPEYAQNLENIALYIASGSPYITETQIEILQQLPDYTQIKLFIESESQREYLKQKLPDNVYSRITFLNAPEGQQFSVWAQDYTEGDNKVQILPLTHLGGGGRKTPDRPENDFIYQLEEAGIEIRKVPVEFGGGNVYISKDKEGHKILLTGGDSYLETQDSYNKVGDSISEEDYIEIMKNAFNVDDVQIVATRDKNGQIERQNSLIFHIDQVMLPLDDGVVAMPIIELPPQSDTQDEIFQEKRQKLMEFAKKYGLEPNLDWDTTIKYNMDWRGYYNLPNEQREKLQEEESKIREGFYEKERVIEVKQQVDQYRGFMKSRGFEIVDLKSNTHSVVNYQAHTNGIVYKDKDTGQKTVIMPIFPDESGEYKMEGINLENKQALEKAGFKVKTVKDRAFQDGGNLHCITILAQAPQNPSSCPLS